MSGNGPSRRSMLFAPLAIAFAGAGASPALARGGVVKSLKPYLFGAAGSMSGEAFIPLSSAGSFLPIREFPKINPFACGTADSAPDEFIGFGHDDEALCGHVDDIALRADEVSSIEPPLQKSSDEAAAE